MAVKFLKICDLCIQDGEVRLAKGAYFSDVNEEWHACSKHLKEVKSYGLITVKFDDAGDWNG